MLKVKNFLFVAILAYIAFFSILFTYNVFELKKQVNRELESDVNPEHHEFINDALYKKVGKSDKYKNKDNCALTIYDAIELEKRKRYDESQTYKDLYMNYSHNRYVFRMNSCKDIIKDCNLSKNDVLKKEIIPHCMHDVATIEYSFYNDYIRNISLDIGFPLDIYYYYYYTPDVQAIRTKNKLDLRSQLISEQKEYINLLLRIGGFDYEQ